MTKKLHPDVRWLIAADKAIRETTPRVREATLKYLWDKYVVHIPVSIVEYDKRKAS